MCSSSLDSTLPILSLLQFSYVIFSHLILSYPTISLIHSYPHHIYYLLQVRKLKAKESDMIKLQLLEMSDSLPPLTKFSYGYKFDPWQRRGKYVPLCVRALVHVYLRKYICPCVSTYVTDRDVLYMSVCLYLWVFFLGYVGLIKCVDKHV